jgi:hypothetical protein
VVPRRSNQRYLRPPDSFFSRALRGQT